MLEEKLLERGDQNTCPIAVIISEGKVLVGLRHYTADKWKPISVWTCPGGRCDSDESIEMTLRREVAEETGLDDLEIIEYCGEFPGAKEGDKVPVFLCTTNKQPQLLEPEKFEEWRWEKPENLASESFINSRVLEFIRGRVL